ncbi:MAG: TIGR04084 family radical SAM/SPASM domain-containing protein [Methanocalculus sp. MSAO_Arc1]|nr:MAG: TIGR04084 family radical SAM/SPASM domain-containing protein [Methanocalculus sp. MSAO_Arc1]
MVVFFHIVVTDDCNLACRYCRGALFEELDEPVCQSAIRDDLPISFDETLLKELYRFLGSDPDPVLTFIGGEPLLNTGLICRIMDEAPCSRYMLQTNGLLLDRLPGAYHNRLETILVSIDGDAAQNDANRGDGVYERVLANARMIRSQGYRGELIARMTVCEDMDIRAMVRHLQELQENPFSSIHWQLDANFRGDYAARNASVWIAESYNPGISALLQDWVSHMQVHGEVPGWYPFLQTTEDLLTDSPTHLRCGSGLTNYTIQTDGSIIPCPIMIGMADYTLGTISTSNPLALPQVQPGSPCRDCAILTFCGGRCLYSNIVKPWPDDGVRAVCSTIYHLRAELCGHLPTIRRLIADGRVNMASFRHTRYNGCEIIP